MSKKYQILNSNIESNSKIETDSVECTIFYILYIVLFFVFIFIIYKIIFCFGYPKESFANVLSTTTDTKNKTVKSPIDVLKELTDKNKELTTIKDTLENKLIDQTQAFFLSQNFNKVDSSSFNDQLSYLLVEFADTKLPELDMENKKIINNQTELDTVLAESKNMKNYYSPGDIVDSSSTFSITKDDICYRYKNKTIKPTPEFMKNYPNCMVCAIEDDKNLTNTQGWKNTKTNISKVCLYDPKASPNSGIPNLSQCKTFCNIESNK